MTLFGLLLFTKNETLKRLCEVTEPTSEVDRSLKIMILTVLCRGVTRIFIGWGGGAACPGGIVLAIEGAPLPRTVTIHYNETYEMLV